MKHADCTCLVLSICLNRYFITIFKIFSALPHFLTKTPLFWLMDQTQRSPPTNYITRRSANMTSHQRPNQPIHNPSFLTTKSTLKVKSSCTKQLSNKNKMPTHSDFILSTTHLNGKNRVSTILLFFQLGGRLIKQNSWELNSLHFIRT